MTASKFKDDMLAISGVTYDKDRKGRIFVGLKVKPEVIVDD